MVVMNDRPQSGSAFRTGQIELIMNRRIYTQDNQGNPEPLNDVDSHNQGLNVSAKYFLSFHNSVDAISKALFEHQIKRLMASQVFYTQDFSLQDK